MPRPIVPRQPVGPLPRPPAGPFGPLAPGQPLRTIRPTLDFSFIANPATIQRVNGRILPQETIANLGIPQAAIAQLTPAAAALTKQNLLDLGGPNAAQIQVALGLTPVDIQSIKVAFSGPMVPGIAGGGGLGGPAALSVSCCCCTPCCCAAAALEPLVKTA